ncbi:MAG: CNNM domain-containing protein, partial [Ardenticatenaceae bacterium]
MDVDSSQWAAFAALAGALLLYMVIGAANAALATISRTRLRLLSEQQVWGAESAMRLLDNTQRLRATLSLLRLLLLVTITAAALVLSASWRGNVVATVVLVWAIALLAQILAGALGSRWFQRVAPAVAPWLMILSFLVAPLRLAVTWLQRQLAGSPVENEEALRLNEEERRVLASVVGEEEADLPEEGREMIHSIVSLGQTTVREVMVPRPDLVALRSDISLREALDTIIQEGHSRIPVYEDNIDNITGILYAKDLLAYLRDGRS